LFDRLISLRNIVNIRIFNFLDDVPQEFKYAIKPNYSNAKYDPFQTLAEI
jgi:hypothetical protein